MIFTGQSRWAEEMERKFIGQSTILTRWVVTKKYINREKRTKARLVARVFGEQNNEVLKDSPMCTKESTRLVLSIIYSYLLKVGIVTQLI